MVIDDTPVKKVTQTQSLGVYINLSWNVQII